MKAILKTIFIALKLNFVIAQDILPTALSIDWTQVQTSSPLTNWNRDIGVCTCDLTVGLCDANCCCDSDCSSADIALWFITCKSTTTLTLPYCSNYLSKVNWYGSINGTATPAVGGGLCVVFTNSMVRKAYAVNSVDAVQGAFFSDPGTFTTDAGFSALFQQGLYINSIANYNITNQVSTSPYTFGSAILVNYPTIGNNANFTIPISSTSRCSDQDYARMMSKEKNTCSRFVPTAASVCKAGSVFDANYYTSGFNFVSDPTSGSTVSSANVQITYNCLDQTNGAVVPGLALSTCSLLASKSPVLTGASCSQMVVGADYTFVYSLKSGLLTINSVKIALWMATQTLSSNTLVSQSFSVNFQSELSSITYTKSGNPGYIYGAPVLAGTSLKNGTSYAVSYIPDERFGITLLKDVPSKSGGPVACTNGATDFENRVPVTFGENTKTGCTMWLKYSDLAHTNCNALRANIYKLQTLTASSIDVVGIFGNASYSNEFSDWVPVINSPPSIVTGSGSNSDVTDGQCDNLLTDFGVEILYTAYGASNNPQYAIVGARFNYTGSGSFQWRCKGRSDCIDPAIYTGGAASKANIGTTAQPFLLRSSVSFVKVATVGTSLYAPPPPQIWATLPDDVWYPFYIPVNNKQ